MRASGEDEHGRRASARAKLAKHAEPVAPREIQIEHDGIERLLQRERERRLAIVRLLDRVPFLAKSAAQIRGHFLFIFDDEEAHECGD